MALFGNKHFYNSLIRKYTLAFGQIFDDITIERTDEINDKSKGKGSGTDYNRVQTIQVPLAYGPKQKFLSRIRQDPDLDKGVGIQLPRISFEMTSIEYDPTRKMSSTQKYSVVDPDDPNKKIYQYVEVPYNINYQVSIFAKNTEDAGQIIEQIIPFFTPDWTLQLKLFDNMEAVDIPYELQGVNPDDVYEGNFEDRRSLVWTLDFLCRARFFGPQRRSDVIKKSIIKFYDEIDASNTVSTYTVQPGLTANGNPTTDVDNSIEYLEINEDDDYGFAEDIIKVIK